MYRREDLIYLVYDANVYYVHLVEKIPVGVEVDLVDGTWKYETLQYRTERLLIGKGIASFGQNYQRPGMPIGVFDRTKLAHLLALLRVSEDRIRELQPILDHDN